MQRELTTPPYERVGQALNEAGTGIDEVDVVELAATTSSSGKIGTSGSRAAARAREAALTAAAATTR